MSSPTDSRLGRLARLGRLTTSVSASYVSDRVRSVFRSEDANKEALDRVHVDNAAKVAEVLGQLKGAAMKVGQQVAMAASSLDLPDEVTGVLSKLHAEAQPIPFDVIKKNVERELEAPLDRLFRSFDPQPIGTASLGQAHAAVLPDGRDVVVKVLHDGIDKSVNTDLGALKAVLVGGRVFRRERAEMDAAFEEVREHLLQELDYLQEAANIELFRGMFGDDPRFRIPRTHPSHSTERVLTMDRLRGVPVARFVDTASREARQRAGSSLAELYYESAFRHRALHADPHPGNYLFEEDGRVGLLDFGCVKRFEPFWLASYAEAALAGIDGRRAAFLDGVRRIDGWHGEDPRAAELLWQFGDTLATPYRKGPYTIGDAEDSTLDRLRPVLQEFVKYPEVVIPRDVIFLHRTLGGLYTLVRQLVATVDLGHLARTHLEGAIRAVA
jgi:predicted unusual protein kinase regulating ubiquinone biosynthesis (AarF/ABC1/UbiB family)